MKFKALAAHCKSYNHITLLDTRDADENVTRQHVATSFAVYPLDGVGEIDEQTLLTIFDVPKNEQEGWTVNRSEMIDRLRRLTEDNDDGDEEAEPMKLHLSVMGYDLIPVYTQHGVLFLNAEQLKPVSDTAKSNTYWTRRVGDDAFIIVKNGFMLVAALAPKTSWAEEPYGEQLSDAARAACQLVEKNAEARRKEEGK